MKSYFILLLLSSMLLMPGQHLVALCGGKAPVIPPRFPNKAARYSLADLVPVTSANAHRLQLISLLSIGELATDKWPYADDGPIWSVDNTTQIIPTTQGIFRYIPTQAHHPPYLLSNLPTAKVMLSRNGQQLLAMSLDGNQMQLWEVQQQVVVATTTLSHEYFGWRMSPDPQFVNDLHIVALVDGQQPGEFAWKQYDAQTLDLVGTLATTTLFIETYTVSADLRYILAATKASSILIDTERKAVSAEWARLTKDTYTSPRLSLVATVSPSSCPWKMAFRSGKQLNPWSWFETLFWSTYPMTC